MSFTLKMSLVVFVNFMILIPVFVVVNANMDLLSKFHQNDYVVVPERGEIVRYNRKYMKFAEFKTFRYNKTAGSIGINASFMFNVDTLYDGELRVQLYKFLSNEYRHFPLRFQVKICDLLKANVFGMADVTKYGNFTGCPIYANKRYCINNFSYDFSQSPPGIPSGRYMLDVEFLFDNAEMALLREYGEVKRPIK